MQLHFVETELTAPELKGGQPASYVRKEFTVDKPVSAALHITALGVFKAYVNGKELDQAMLLPGFTDYRYRVQVRTYDITGYLRDGVNVIAVIVGEGWYRGACGAGSTTGFYGKKLKLAAMLELEDAQGKRVIETDQSWKATQDGPLTENDIKTYETYDSTRELTGWMEPGYDDGAWHNAIPAAYAGTCIPFEGEPVLEHEVFTPTVLVTPNGETVLDFGQNHAGHVEFTVTGTRGHQVSIVLGEVLDENGNFTQKNVSSVEGAGNLVGALGQTLRFVCSGKTDTYKPLFLVSGYRYAKLENWPETVAAENFRSYAVYSDVKPAGHFECSNPDLNQLVSNVMWSQKSNYVEIPTDCPTRERAGWSGDINVFSETACWLTDTNRFLNKWLKDFALEQKEDGSLPYVIPEVDMDIIPVVNMNEVPRNSAGWSDAFIHVPMVLYRFYGDTKAIETVYEGAKRFIDFDLKRAEKKNILHLFKTGKHYRYILDTGYHWGEWTEPGHEMMKDLVKAFFFPDAEVATAWLYHSTKEVAEMAGILGKTADEKKYSEIAGKIRDAYRKEFLKNGTVKSDRQCRYVRPVMMGLVSDEEAKTIMADLNEMIVKNGYKIGTGFLTTFRILHTLAEYGYADTAYRLLLNEECPGWLYEIRKGATTTWEKWTNIGDDNVPHDSMNHYSPGAAVSFVFECICGIKATAPGFKTVQIKPHVSKELSFAKARHETPYGPVVSEWKQDGGMYSFYVETPEEIETTVILPDGTTDIFRGGVKKYSC